MSRIVIDRTLLSQLCKTQGPFVHAPAGLDGAKILWALTGNESSFGQNCTPRHEPAYCWKGRYFQAVETKDWGCLQHCSFGPTQIMACNAIGFAPLELLNDFEKCIEATVAFLNREILGHQKAVTLSEIADAYNSGNWKDANIPDAYISRFLRAYMEPMP